MQPQLEKKQSTPRLKVFQKSFQIKNNGSLNNSYARADDKKLGSGGFGQIFRIYDRSNSEKNDIKCLKMVSKRDRQQAMNEINSLRVLSHPNIIKYYEHFDNNKYIFLIIEYIKGLDMIDYINSGKQITEKKASTIMQQLLEALACAHENKIVHRDVKCENIMIIESQDEDEKDQTEKQLLENDGQQEPKEQQYSVNVKLIDWGFSYNLSILNQEYIENKSQLGTQSYMSPEQIQKQKYNGKCDIWSAGVVLYCLLTKSFPFFSFLKFSDRFLHYQQESLSQFQKQINEADSSQNHINQNSTSQNSDQINCDTNSQDKQSSNPNEQNTLLLKEQKVEEQQQVQKPTKEQLQRILQDAKYKFEEERTEDIFDQILKKEPVYDESILSEEAIDLLMKMLNKDQEKRWSAKQLLKHPWFQNRYTEVIQSDKVKENLQKMKNFTYQNEFQIAVWTYISSHLVEDKEKQELQAIFKRLDKDNSGGLSKEEIKQGFEEMELEINDENLDQLFDQIDSDKNGFIDYNEFLACTLNHSHILKKTYLQKVFNLIDADKNGSISLNELKNILGSPDQRMKEEFQCYFQEIFSQIDINNDGEISFEEFEKLISFHIENQSQNQQLQQNIQIDNINEN